MTRWACVALVVLLAGCALERRPPPSGDGLRAVFVVLGAEGRPMARVITTDATCPPIDIDGVAQPMAVRAAPAVIPARPSRFDPAAVKPAAFPVLTCEAPIASGAARATIAGRALPLPKANPQRIVVLGDTGCRMATWGNVFQNCNDPATWPFRTLADTAAAMRPDLVIHVGDYHYREDRCPAGNAGCAGSPWGYGWDAWEVDFFAPAGRLLAAAPWIVVRGNHESCSRAGQGWWRFLDPRPLAARQDCNDPANDATGDYSEPYAVPLRSGSGADTQAIVFDSSLAGIRPLAPTDPMYVNYRRQFERAFALAARTPNNFVVFHHPVLAFSPNPGKPDAPYPGNQGLQSVLEPLHPAVLFPASVQAVLGGHTHLFEVVSFATPQPAQVVAGNGGDWVDDPFPAVLSPTLTPSPGAVIERMVWSREFGFMTMEPDGGGWQLVARDVHGAPMTTCTLNGRRAACAPLRKP